jgi:uncharacterized membrane protein YsdA (DUF1294 family)/cold shock CspA family protein
MQEQKGTILRWDDEKGFGFIATQSGEKFFFHISAVRGAFRPKQGEAVMFQAGKDAQGRPAATHVRSESLAVDNPRIRVKPKTQSAPASTSPSSKPRAASTTNKRHLREQTIPLLVLLILPVAGVADLAMNYQAPWAILVYVVASLLTYYFYWDDKRRAKRNEWRIPEANLHLWALVGGWPGAFIAQQQFRHKTKKVSFLIVFWLVVAAHQIVWFDWLVMDGNWLLSLMPVGTH